MKVHSFKNRNEADRQIASYISRIYEKDTNILISGGTSLFGVLDILSTTSKSYNFFLSDERDVEIQSSESNLNNYKSLKYQNMNFLGFLSSNHFVDSIQNYENTLKDIKFDLAVLGVGLDGHIASIFPRDSKIILETSKSIYCTSIAHKHNRFSLKLDYILLSKKIILYFNGSQKIKAYNNFFKLQSYRLYEFIINNENLEIYLGESI